MAEDQASQEDVIKSPVELDNSSGGAYVPQDEDKPSGAVATKFRRGGDGVRPGEATDSCESKPPTPKFRFLLGVRPLYLKSIGKY